VLLQLGQQAHAFQLFRANRERAPELAVLGASEALIGLDKPVEALNLLRAIIEDSASVDGCILAAHICLQQNELASFQSLLQCAYDGVIDGLKERHRLKILNELLAHPAQAIRRVS
jgi:hypothetical protein